MIYPDVLSMPITFDDFNQPEVVRESTSNNPYPNETKSMNNLPQDCPLLELEYGILTEKIGPIVQQIRRTKHWDRMDFILDQLMWYPKRYYVNTEYRLNFDIYNTHIYGHKVRTYNSQGGTVEFFPGKYHLDLFLRNWNVDFKKIQQSPSCGESLEVIVDHIYHWSRYFPRNMCQRWPYYTWGFVDCDLYERYFIKWMGMFIQTLKDIDISLVYLEEAYAEHLERVRRYERRSLFKQLPNYV